MTQNFEVNLTILVGMFNALGTQMHNVITSYEERLKETETRVAEAAGGLVISDEIIERGAKRMHSFMGDLEAAGFHGDGSWEAMPDEPPFEGDLRWCRDDYRKAVKTILYAAIKDEWPQFGSHSG